MSKRKQVASRFTVTQKITIAIMVAALATSLSVVPGMTLASGFVDDWIAQKSATGPSAFQGAQRGYYTAGSFSARVPSTNDHLMTITMPALKSGCGGIDMFLGGFSFLNVDYLVQKMQRILAQAPAAAFDIALKTLAPQVSETIKTLESLVDKLNDLQINDCKAAKALVATTASPFSAIMSDSVNAELKAAQTGFLQDSGANDLYKGVQGLFDAQQKSAGGYLAPGSSNPIADSAKGATAGCPQEILDVFGTDGSLLDALANKKGLPAAYVPVLRGFIGDVAILTPSSTGATYDAVYIPPCDKNDGLMPFLDGDGQQRNSVAEGCTIMADSNKNLNTYVATMMAAIAGKLKSKSALSTEETSFLQSMPLPISVILKNAVASKTEEQVTGRLADITAKAFAYYMMADMLGKALQLHAQAKHIASTEKNAKPGSDSSTCSLTLLEPAINKIELLETSTLKVLATARETYAESLAESQALESFVQSMARFKDQITQELANQFGSPVARRATGS